MENYETFEISTPRLILRVPRMEDAEEMQAAKVEVWPELQKWMSWATDDEYPIEALVRNIETTPASIAAGGFPMLGRCRETGRFVVRNGLNRMDDDLGRLETGYWVAKEFLGKGYATEACNAAIRFGFNALAAKNIYICHYEGNKGSQRIIEKLGFTPTGILPKAHRRFSDGILMDRHEYELTDPQRLPPLDVSWRYRCP